MFWLKSTCPLCMLQFTSKDHYVSRWTEFAECSHIRSPQRMILDTRVDIFKLTYAFLLFVSYTVVSRTIRECATVRALNRFFCCFFSVWLLSVLRGHSVFSSPPQRPMTLDFEGFSIPDFIHYIYFPILILEKEPVFSLFNVQC